LLYAGFMITIAAAEAVSRPSAVYQVWLSPCVVPCWHPVTNLFACTCCLAVTSRATFLFVLLLQLKQHCFVPCNPEFAACMAACCKACNSKSVRLAQSRFTQQTASHTSTYQGFSCAQAEKCQHYWLLQLPTCHMQPLLDMQGMLLHTLGVVGGAATGVICYAMLLIIRVQPWWHAQYFIPTLGMILGNCISGVSVGLSSVMDELTTGESGGLQHNPP